MINISIVNERDEALVRYQSKYLNYCEGRTIIVNDGQTQSTSSYKILSITHLVTYIDDGVGEGAVITVKPIDKQ